MDTESATLPTELLAKIRQIEIRTRKVVDNVFSGEYHTIFKGRGMEFSEVRQYQPGDDIRSMDWNVTARAGEPYVKVFKEERELTLMLVVDVSASGNFGSHERFKVEIAAEICAALAFSAIKNSDKVGLLSFTDQIEQYIKPKKGRAHVLRLIRDVLFHKPKGRGGGIGAALDYLNKVQKKKAIVFLISDFIDSGFERQLNVTSKKHDLVAVRLDDPRERILPDVGRINLHDAESGQMVMVNTSDYAIRKEYEEKQKTRRDNLKQLFGASGVDEVLIDCERPYFDPLIRFFKQRERRRRFG